VGPWFTAGSSRYTPNDLQITGGGSKGFYISPDYITQPGIGTISESDMNKWIAMGGDPNQFHQINNQWYSDQSGIGNVLGIVDPNASGAISPFQGPSQAVLSGGIGGSGAPQQITSSGQNPAPTPAQQTTKAQANNATNSTAPTPVTPNAAAGGVPSMTDMRTYNAMQGIYGSQNKLPGYAGSY